MQSNPRAETWLKKLARLRPAAGRNPASGVAPHKPLLLLCLLDLADLGELPATLTKSASLALRFRAYGTIVAGRWPTRLDLRLPLYHLKNQGLWVARDARGQPATAPENCVTAELDPEFHASLLDPEFRADARALLAQSYFSAEECAALFVAMGLGEQTVAEEKSAYLASLTHEAMQRKGRSARFQVGVVDGYLHTCALTGYRCFTDDGATVVDAAHIVSWAESQDDRLGNGLALSKTAHWMFDEGLWSVSDDFRVVLDPSRFVETGPFDFRLAQFSNRPLHFAPNARLRPSLECLRRHREKHRFNC